MAEEKHFYGGQAIMEGVMMRGTKAWGAAVRRTDGQIAVYRAPFRMLSDKYRWANWPFVRGNVALVDTLILGLRSLIYSFNILVEEEMEKERKKAEEAAAAEAAEAEIVGEKKKKKKPPKKQSDSGWAVWLALLPSFAIGIGLFVLLPTLVVGWLTPPESIGSIGKNLIEGIVRLAVILTYISLVGLMPDIRRIFQLHGAEHATINCYEAGEKITLENCRRYSPLHPRCGTAFMLVFIVVKIIVGCFFGWPEMAMRIFLRLVTIPLVAAVAYEIIRYGGRHRDSWVARILAQPGLFMQRLTTRKPDDTHLETAIYALATVAPEVPLPEGFRTPVKADMSGKLLPQDDEELAEADSSLQPAAESES